MYISYYLVMTSVNDAIYYIYILETDTDVKRLSVPSWHLFIVVVSVHMEKDFTVTK